MTEPKTINIHLSPTDLDRLESEAQKRHLTIDTLASILLHERLVQVNQSAIPPREALHQLREIGKKMPLIDAVQLARESRQQLEQRGAT